MTVCYHDHITPVILPDGEEVSIVCMHCFAALPAHWPCPDCEWEEIRTFDSYQTWPVLGWPCRKHTP